ncbi:MAG TPA: hypothetical protein VE985_10035 [Gaiellaceae bacterium]|nr:hypothetical protein [Gaiellaceae bacterium]
MHIKGRYAIGIGLAALVAAGVLTVVASGDPITTTPFWFIPTNEQPRAGQTFTGLVLDSLSAQTTATCGRATVGGVRATPQNHIYFGGTQWSTTVCSWRIPKGTAGKKLRVSGATAGSSGAGQTSLDKIGPILWIVSH